MTQFNYDQWIGKKFNRLTIIGRGIIRETPYGNINRYLEVQCDCGKKTHAMLAKLKNGSTKSCGCRKKEKIIESHLTHGMSEERIYHIWKDMKSRCNNPKYHDYYLYGERGIKILWDSFEEFYADMGDSYKQHYEIHGSRNTTIDRIDTDGHYCKENCKWSTQKEQANNKRNNIILTHNGKTMSIYDWAKELGISINTLLDRYYKKKPIDDVLDPIIHYNDHI